MTSTPENSSPRIEVQVADDRLSAHLALRIPEGEPPPDAAEIIEALADVQIPINDELNQGVSELVRLIGEQGAPERFLIARGRPVVEGKDAEFIWDPFFEQAVEEWQEDAPIDYYTCNTIVTAEAGQTLGTIQPATPGEPGLDVYGKPIPPKHRPVQITLHDSVAPSQDDPRVIVSRVPGRVNYKNRTLAINEVLDIRGDVDFESGSIRSSVDVQIGGTIRDNFVVSSEKSVTVSGAVEAAEVRALGDVVVRGGILGHHRGTVHADGQIVAKFCDRAHLHARGDIKIARLIMDSRIHTEQKVCAERAAVMGGLIYARQEVAAASLGSEANVPTMLVLGVHWDVLKESRAIDSTIDEMRRTAARIHKQADPLLTYLRHLNPEQKERATELLFRIQEIDLAIAERAKQRDQMLQAARAEASPTVIVSKIIYAGARIRINNREVVFDRDMKGPVRIEKRLVERTTEFVAVNQITGSLTVLSSERIEGDPTPLQTGNETSENRKPCATAR